MSFFAELKRRNVVRVGIAYVVASWLLLQLTEVLTELLDLPDEAGRFVILLLLIGFIPALIFAWAFELTPEGIKRDSEVDRTHSITNQTGRKLDWTIIGMLALVAGYFIWEARFKAPDVEQATASAPASITTGSDAGAPTAGVQELSSIAVLPFANRSNLDDDLFFTDGIHDDLLTQLSKIDDLKVISRTSVMEYRGTTKKIPEIAQELGVGKILEGGVQRAGQRIRINAQLIDVATDEHLWAETFDREMTVDNIFDIQSEITRQIVAAVKGELSPDEQHLISEAPTDNIESYEAYLHARAATNLADYGRDKYVEAEPWAKRAVELDSEFAQAWALLAAIHAQAIWQGYDTSPQRQRDTRDALSTAVSLAPTDPQVLAAQADIVYRLDNNYPVAYELFKKAEQAAPGDALITLFKGITERRLGLWEEAITSMAQAYEKDPGNQFIATQRLDTLERMNAWDRMEPLVDEWLSQDPGARDIRAYKALVAAQKYGDLDEARRQFALIAPSSSAIYVATAMNLHRWQRDYDGLLAFYDSPEFRSSNFFSSFAGVLQGEALLFSGDTEAGKARIKEGIETLGSQQLNTPNEQVFQHNFLAASHAYLGEAELALMNADLATELLPMDKDAVFGAGAHKLQTRIMAMLGYEDEAIERLTTYLDKPEGFNRYELAVDPRWDFFRSNEAFAALTASRTIKQTTR